MEKSEPPTIAVNLKNTKYSTILNHAIEKMGWKTTKMNTAGKNKDWDILWTDSSRGFCLCNKKSILDFKTAFSS